jgi:hypothetical protein
MPSASSVGKYLEGRVREGSRLTHDGARCHGPAIRKFSLGDDWAKYAPGDKEYKAKMAPMNNLCSYLKLNLEKHRDIKFAKLPAYGNLFMYQYFYVRKYGLEATIDYLFSRVCGTEKSHNYDGWFSKTSAW